MRKVLTVGMAGVVLITVLSAAFLIRRNLVATADCDDIKAFEQANAAARSERLAVEGPLTAFVGDSYTAGQHLPSALDGYPYQAMPGGRVLVSGIGGSGYTTSGPCPDVSVADRLPEVLAQKPATLVIQAGRNDMGEDARDDIEDTLDLVQTDARVIVLGPFGPPSAAPGEVTALADDIRTSAEAHGFEYVPVDGWVTSWLPDDNHPDARGAKQIAEHLAVVLHKDRSGS